jgi:p-aminobenzoyl-glutamate transporter AbgT
LFAFGFKEFFYNPLAGIAASFADVNCPYIVTPQKITFFDFIADKPAISQFIEEMSKELGISERAVYQRLHTLGIEPVTRQVIYPKTALEAIREVSKGGRPRKEEK